MVKADKQTRKDNYFKKLEGYLAEYPRALIVNVDNVGSKQMQKVRIALRGKAEILMGKKTMMRRCITKTENESYAELLPHLRGNVGLIFTHGDLLELVDLLETHKVAAPARVGAVAQDDVIIPKGITNMDAQKTSFFQALNIATKITKTLIEIVSDVHILKEGDRVGPSEAALLNMLGISPFTYGVDPIMVYEQGSTYSPDVLSIRPADVLAKFMSGVANVAAVSLALGMPNAASVPHMIVNGYKNVLSVALATDISFPQAEKAKAFLKDPSAFAVVAAPAAASGAPAAGGAAAAAKAPEPEPEPEEEEGMDGFSLFD